jgi:hypothetical protein
MRRKIVKKFLLFTLALLSFGTFGQSDYSRYCTSPKDLNTQMVCALSKQLDTSPVKVGMAMVFASIEIGGTYCDFGFSRKFLDTRIKVLSDLEVDKVVKFLVSSYSGKPPPGYTGDDKHFCKMQYETFGPRSQEKFYR